jgi:hypothetical protein
VAPFVSCMVFCTLFVLSFPLISFFCLSFFKLRLLNIPLLSSNLSV